VAYNYRASRGSLTSTAIPNLISGVSQQPPTLRVAANSDEDINRWLSVVSGNNKRPPTEHLLKLPAAIDQNSVGYLIDRDAAYRYFVAVGGSTVKVFDLSTGLEQTVLAPSGFTYLSQASDPTVDFRFVTIGDTTFIANRDVTVQEDNYGEVGAYSFSYTTVATFASLPGSPTLGQIVYVTDQDKFYQWKSVGGTTTDPVWNFDGNSGSSAGYTLVTSLPVTVVVGVKYAISYQERSNNPVITGCAVYDSKGNCQSYTYGYTYSTKYHRYTGVAGSATGGTNQWVALQGSELDRTVVGRVNPTGKATVYITQAVGNVNYSVYLNGTLLAFYTTPNGSSGALSVPGTDAIAGFLKTALVAAPLPGGVTCTQYGSTLAFAGLASTDLIAVTATGGDKTIKCYQDSIDSFSNLPPNEAPGRIVRVKGDVKDNGDDYYVVYNSKNLWEETWGWNQGSKPVATSMPHALVNNKDGTWTFKPWTWDSRAAGDTTSNPSPSFVGSKIQDLFLYSDRLGFVADENVIFSETNSFENFYRTSLAVLVDSDELDLAVLNTGVDLLYHATQYNDDLLLWSDRHQYRLRYSNFLGPKNVEVKYTTSFNAAPDVKPVSMGGSIYFVDDKPDYSYLKVWEFFPQVNQVGDDADESSAGVPEYLRSGASFIAGSPRLHTVVLNSGADPDMIYVYKYFWGSNNQKIQNAWCKWQFPDCQKVVWAGFAFNYLYVMIQRSDGVYLERIKMEEKISKGDPVTQYMIDRSTGLDKLLVTYDAVTDTSTITLPWALGPSSIPEVVSISAADITNPWIDLRHTVTQLTPTTLKVEGRLDNAQIVRAGIKYTSLHRFSKPYLRQTSGTGQVAVLDDLRLTMKYLTVYAEETAHFTAVIKYPGRADRFVEYDHFIADDESVQVGGVSFRSRKNRIAIQGNNEDLTLELRNDTPFNAQFTAAEWQFVYNTRAKNRM
jgi:hypothetical protein